MLYISKKKTFHNKCYSQSGEDIIVNRILGRLKIDKPLYLDLGAYDPTVMSNTFHFYEKGLNGVVVEANPNLIENFKKLRPRDRILNIGVGTQIQDGSSLAFYEFKNQSISTFSIDEKQKLLEKGEIFINTHQVQIHSLNSIIANYCNRKPNFISVDLEGIDFEVLKDFDFNSNPVEVFCIETIQMPEETKNEAVINLMKQNGYMVYADTYINTIFVLEASWKNRLT